MLDDLPVAALRLDPATVLVLRRLGLKRIGELSGVARDALARRFRNTRAPGANPLVRLDQLLGKVPEPLLPVVAHDMPLVQRRLMEPIRHRACSTACWTISAPIWCGCWRARRWARGGSSWGCGKSMARC